MNSRMIQLWNVLKTREDITWDVTPFKDKNLTLTSQRFTNITIEEKEQITEKTEKMKIIGKEPLDEKEFIEREL